LRLSCRRAEAARHLVGKQATGQREGNPIPLAVDRHQTGKRRFLCEGVGERPAGTPYRVLSASSRDSRLRWEGERVSETDSGERPERTISI
jgi:hypothetical protein